jgi:hypothetical protein
MLLKFLKRKLFEILMDIGAEFCPAEEIEHYQWAINKIRKYFE